MNIPKHIAIIMDGNGRWASKRFLPRIQGHQKGVKTVREAVKHCGKLGVKTLTLFAFSSENKNRSTEEVSLLFKLFLSVLKQETSKLNKHNVKLKIIGDLGLFPQEVQKTAVDAQALLVNNTGLTLVIAALASQANMLCWDDRLHRNNRAILCSMLGLQIPFSLHAF